MQTPEAGSSEHFPIQMRHALQRALSYNLFPIQIRHPAQNQSEDQNAPPYRDQTTLNPYAWCSRVGTGKISGPGVGELRPLNTYTVWGYKERPSCSQSQSLPRTAHSL